MNKRIIFIVLILSTQFFFNKCDSINSPDLPIPLENLEDITGAYLRILKVNSSVFDMSNLNDARYEFLGELYDIHNGANVDRVDFYASYISVESNDIEEPTKPIATYSYLDFTIQESGLPGTTFSIYLSDILHS